MALDIQTNTLNSLLIILMFLLMLQLIINKAKWMYANDAHTSTSPSSSRPTSIASASASGPAPLHRHYLPSQLPLFPFKREREGVANCDDDDKEW